MGNFLEPPKPDKPMVPIKNGMKVVLFVANGCEDFDKTARFIDMFSDKDLSIITQTEVTPTYFGESRRCVALSTVCYMEMVSYQLARKDYLDALVGYIESLINQVN